MQYKRLMMYPAFMSASDPHEFKKTLGVSLVYRDRNYHPREGDVIVCWGNSKTPDWAIAAKEKQCVIINHWDNLKKAVNKISTFQTIGLTVPWTLTRSDAIQWGKTSVVVCRHEIKGNKGSGIEVILPGQHIPPAPLYTRFVPNCEEYRVHVAFGKVINFQQKKKKIDAVCNPYIRSEENGYVFCIKNISLPEEAAYTSLKAVERLGLDFGAVDCLYSPIENEAYVLEVNTAPGLAYHYGIEAYTEAFRNYIDQL